MNYPRDERQLRDFWVIFFLALVVLNFMVYYFRPITDSDIWFHLLYGKIYIEQKRLTIDHTMFSWTPTSSEPIYHTLIGSVLYYLGYKLLGINAIFVIRFLVLVAFNLLAIFFMIRLNLLRNYIAWFFLVSSQVFLIHVAQDKPTIFSFFFMTFTSFWYWYLVYKREFDCRLFYVFPLVMLVWVNTHGGFIFGVAFYLTIFLGELVNYLVYKRNSFDSRIMHHFYISMILSFISCFITPYGYKYIFYLFNTLVLGKQDPLLFLSINEYAPTLSMKPYLDWAIYFTILFFLFLFFLSNLYEKRLNFSALFSNILFIYLFFKYIRTTFFLAPVLFFSCLLMIKGSLLMSLLQRKYIYHFLFSLIFLFCLHNTIFYFYRTFCVLRFSGFSLGKGIGYFEQETDIILRYLKGYRICNEYICGSYLLWRGWPEIKVMIDARQFPYRDWFREYFMNFYGARNHTEYLTKYGCEVVFVSYNAEIIKYLIKDPLWNLVFVGQRGVIFKKNTISLPLEAYGVQHTAFDFSFISQADKFITILMNVGDLETLERLLDYFQNRIICDRQRQELEARRNLYLSLKAYLKGDYIKMDDYLNKINLKFIGDVGIYADLSLRLAQYYIDIGDLIKAHELVKRAYVIKRVDDLAFSLGVIKWLMHYKNTRADNDRDDELVWKTLLQNYLKGRVFSLDNKTILASQILFGQKPERITIY